MGSGPTEIIKGIELPLTICSAGEPHARPLWSFFCRKRYFGNYGFIQCGMVKSGMACYSQKRRDAANNMIEERVNTHFSALNDLVILSTRADVGNIVLVMPWYGRGYGLHPDFDRQMIREAEALRQARSLCLGGHFSHQVHHQVRWTAHGEHGTQPSSIHQVLFRSGSSRLSSFRLRSCKPLIEIAEMKKRREESLANPQPENNPQWEEMEEVLVSVEVDGWRSL